MAKLAEIREALIIKANSIYNDEVRTDDEFWDSQIHKARAAVIVESWKLNKRIHPQWVQYYKPKFDIDIQDSDCYVKFPCYDFIRLDQRQDGMRFIGSVLESLNFRRINSRGQLSNYNKNRVTKLGRNTVALVDNGFIEVYGNPDIEEILVGQIASVPTQISSFNKEVDQYPVTEELIPLMELQIFRNEAMPVFSRIPDNVSDSTDLPNQTRK